MDTRKPVDGSAVLLMMVLCATWGMQQVVLKATAADIAPVMQIALRSGVAALLAEESLGDWFARADAALYHSKDGGRNQVRVVEPA